MITSDNVSFDVTNFDSHHPSVQRQLNETENSKPIFGRKQGLNLASICNFIKSNSISILMVIIIVLLTTIVCFVLILLFECKSQAIDAVDANNKDLPVEQSIWFDQAIEELKIALNVQKNTRRAKNVILFVGDGMGLNTMTASRIYKHGEEGRLSWELFPHIGLLKTYCTDKQVCDSASTATALFCGVKSNYETSGVDSAVNLSVCDSLQNKMHNVDSILKWAQDEQMATGFVTTARIVHATPSALYSHVADRRWECESKMSAAAKERGCKDIARQLVEDYPGRNINVIMGGGRQCMVSNVTGTPEDPIDEWSCYSADGRNLINEWSNDKNQRHLSHAVVQNNAELNNLDVSTVDYVMGVFANGHLKYDHERDTGPRGMPSLTNMTEKALGVLSRNENGFVLVVEGGLIDQAHHRGWARRALSEVSAMDYAVQKTINFMKSQLGETLIIVTADHSHTLSINGYPKRGNDILGTAQMSKMDNTPYTTLTYATGGPASFQMAVDSKTGKIYRKDPTLQNISAYDYVQQSAVLTNENTHGGADVTVHAIGPMSHLFHRIHEQSYMAHAISYAAKIGRFRRT